MEGEEGVVFIVGQEVVLGQGELNPEEERKQTADEEEEETEEEVHDADLFVVGGGQPGLQEAPESFHGERLR